GVGRAPGRPAHEADPRRAQGHHRRASLRAGRAGVRRRPLRRAGRRRRGPAGRPLQRRRVAADRNALLASGLPPGVGQGPHAPEEPGAGTRQGGNMAEYIVTERQPNGVELIRLNRPPFNALSAELLTELGDHVEALAADPDLKAVVLTGTEKAFAAGAEISQIRTETDRLLGAFRRAYD